MGEDAFEQAIFDHLALAERNKKLERSMPIAQYRRVYGGGDGRTEHDDRAAQTDPAGFVPDFEWDATAERSLPTFGDWGDGVRATG